MSSYGKSERKFEPHIFQTYDAANHACRDLEKTGLIHCYPMPNDEGKGFLVAMISAEGKKSHVVDGRCGDGIEYTDVIMDRDDAEKLKKTLWRGGIFASTKAVTDTSGKPTGEFIVLFDDTKKEQMKKLLRE
jgi:hypothetical protein